MGQLRIEQLSAANIVAVNSLSLKPGQEQFVVPVSYSAAAAVSDPATAWQRVVMDDDTVVAYVQGNFDAHAVNPLFRSCIWRINVDAEDQGRGIGRFAVEAVAREAAERGFDRVTVVWEAGSGGPEAFFRRVGFTPIGETRFGDVIGELRLGGSGATAHH